MLKTDLQLLYSKILPQVQDTITNLTFKILQQSTPIGYDTTKKMESIEKPDKLIFKIRITVRKDKYNTEIEEDLTDTDPENT